MKFLPSTGNWLHANLFRGFAFLSILGLLPLSIYADLRITLPSKREVSLKAMAPAPRVSPKELGLSTNSLIVVSWPSLTAPASARVDHYEVWYSSNFSAPFLLLKNTGLDTQYLVNQPIQSSLNTAYYTVWGYVSYTTASTNDISLRLEWDASRSTNPITKYQVYYGDAHATYTNVVSTGSNLWLSVSNLVPRSTYYFTVTATDEEGAESEYSNEVSLSMPAAPVPVNDTNKIQINPTVTIIKK